MAHIPGSSNSILKTRIILFACFVVLGFGAMTFRLFWVQIKNHEFYLGKARRMYTTSRQLPPQRGCILDRNGNILVGNVPCEELVCDPSICGDEDICRIRAMVLEEVLGIPMETSLAKMMRKTRQVRNSETGEMEERPLQYAMLAQNIPLEKAIRLRDIFKKNKLSRGMFFRETYMRNYPKGGLLANILGYTTMDQGVMVPLSGLEVELESELTGTFGRTTYERDLAGRPLHYGRQEVVDRHNGLNVCLTIDEVIQSIVEEELDALMERVKPEGAYAVLMDPKTCDILAIAQRPSFDPSDRSNMDVARGGRMRFIEDVYEPGSIMKALTVAGAIDRGVVRPEDVFFCENGRWIFMNRPLTDSHSYGDLSVAQIIQKSSNIGTAKIAIQMGKEMLNDVLRGFGIGSPSGIPLPGESRGIFRRLEDWSAIDISRISIGYSVAVTPLQMARAYCALADNGNLRPVRLIDRCIDPETGEVTVWEHPEPVKLFSRPETTQEMMEMMKLVTKPGGTAVTADIPGYYVAGKTGTARKHSGAGYGNKYFASFAGIVPAEAPRFVLLITVDSPSTSYYGGTVAGPTFRKIAERVLKYMNIPPHPDLLEEYEREQQKQEAAR